MPRVFAALPWVPGGVKLPVNKHTRSQPYRLVDWYTMASQMLVAAYAAEDFERWGYDRKELPA